MKHIVEVDVLRSYFINTYLFPYHVAQACAGLLGLPRLHGRANTGMLLIPARSSIMVALGLVTL